MSRIAIQFTRFSAFYTPLISTAAAGFLVLALLLSSTLSLSESFRLEQEDRALEGLVLLPVDPVALFYGKAIGNTLFLLLLAPLFTPVALVLYTVELGFMKILTLVGLWALAAAGLSAPGTLYAAMTSRLRSEGLRAWVCRSAASRSWKSPLSPRPSRSRRSTRMLMAWS